MVLPIGVEPERKGRGEVKGGFKVEEIINIDIGDRGVSLHEGVKEVGLEKECDSITGEGNGGGRGSRVLSSSLQGRRREGVLCTPIIKKYFGSLRDGAMGWAEEIKEFNTSTGVRFRVSMSVPKHNIELVSGSELLRT